MSAVTALVVAAGRGSRLGGPVPKAFISLRGVPLFWRSLRAVTQPQQVTAAVLVVPPGCEAEASAALEIHGPPRVSVAVTPGGTERCESVRRGLALVETPFVAVHDAARPLVRAETVEAVIVAAIRSGAAIAAVPVTDTVKRVDSGGRITATVPRADLWAARTPQVFRTELLRAAHQRSVSGSEITDDAMLVEILRVPVQVVPDAPENRKITTPDDLAWAEWWLQRQAAPR